LQNRDFTLEEKQAIKTFLSVWCKYLHCGVCIHHCDEYMGPRLASIDEWVKTDEFWKFGVAFHNEVNRNGSAKKPEITLEEAEKVLLDKITKSYRITDISAFGWIMEDFTHVCTMFTMAYITQVKLGHQEATDRMKTFCESLAFIMPFQFSTYKERTLREIWIEKVATWDWTAIKNDVNLIYEQWRELFTAIYPAQKEYTDRMVNFLNANVPKPAEPTQTESKPNEHVESKEETQVTTAPEPQTVIKHIDMKCVYLFVIFHVLLLVIIMIVVKKYVSSMYQKFPKAVELPETIL
jgi:hypothetical protein